MGSLLRGVPACPRSPGWVPCRRQHGSIPPCCTSPSPPNLGTVSSKGSKPSYEEMLVGAVTATPRHGSRVSPAGGFRGVPRARGGTSITVRGCCRPPPASASGMVFPAPTSPRGHPAHGLGTGRGGETQTLAINGGTSALLNAIAPVSHCLLNTLKTTGHFFLFFLYHAVLHAALSSKGEANMFAKHKQTKYISLLEAVIAARDLVSPIVSWFRKHFAGCFGAGCSSKRAPYDNE